MIAKVRGILTMVVTIVICLFGIPASLVLLPFPNSYNLDSSLVSTALGWCLAMWAIGAIIVVTFGQVERPSQYTFVSGMALALLGRFVLPGLLAEPVSSGQYPNFLDPFTLHFTLNIVMVACAALVLGKLEYLGELIADPLARRIKEVRQPA